MEVANEIKNLINLKGFIQESLGGINSFALQKAPIEFFTYLL
jgi:hypothetical protein